MSRTQQEEQNDHECELAAWELLEEAKATADLWIQKAKEAEQAAADLKAELEDTRRHWKEELAAVQARLLDPHAVYINMLHGKIAKLDWPTLEHINGPHPLREQLAAERALADRLGDALRVAYGLITRHHEVGVTQELGCFCPVCHRDGKEPEMDQIIAALAAWKEARND